MPCLINLYNRHNYRGDDGEILEDSFNSNSPTVTNESRSLNKFPSNSQDFGNSTLGDGTIKDLREKIKSITDRDRDIDKSNYNRYGENNDVGDILHDDTLDEIDAHILRKQQSKPDGKAPRRPSKVNEAKR